MSSISRGLCDGGKSVFGVVYNPYTDEIFTAVHGEGAYLNGKRLSVVDREPHNSLVEFGAGSTRKHEADEAFRIGKEVFMHCLDLRRICSSALAICFIAAGRINGYFEKVIKPWDYAAASLILEAAGGSLCDWTGAPLPFDRPSGIIAGSPKTYEYLKSVLLQQSARLAIASFVRTRTPYIPFQWNKCEQRNNLNKKFPASSKRTRQSVAHDKKEASKIKV